MGLLDKLKGLFKGRESQVKGGIDTVSNKVESTVGPKHADKVDDLSQKAKDAVDDITKNDAPATARPATARPATSPPAATAPPDPSGPPAT